MSPIISEIKVLSLAENTHKLKEAEKSSNIIDVLKRGFKDG